MRLPLLRTAIGLVACFAATNSEAQLASAPRPIFFAPLRVTSGLPVREHLLRETLSTELVRSGVYSEAVSAETRSAWTSCVGELNQDTTADQCWIRLGQGQGAQFLVSGGVRGDPSSCVVVLRFTQLETRTSVRKHVRVFEPCSEGAIRADLARAAVTWSARPGDHAGGVGASGRSRSGGTAASQEVARSGRRPGGNASPFRTVAIGSLATAALMSGTAAVLAGRGATRQFGEVDRIGSSSYATESLAAQAEEHADSSRSEARLLTGLSVACATTALLAAIYYSTFSKPTGNFLRQERLCFVNNF